MRPSITRRVDGRREGGLREAAGGEDGDRRKDGHPSNGLVRGDADVQVRAQPTLDEGDAHHAANHNLAGGHLGVAEEKK